MTSTCFLVVKVRPKMKSTNQNQQHKMNWNKSETLLPLFPLTSQGRVLKSVCSRSQKHVQNAGAYVET
jgi:hypothetical protein